MLPCSQGECLPKLFQRFQIEMYWNLFNQLWVELSNQNESDLRRSQLMSCSIFHLNRMFFLCTIIITNYMWCHTNGHSNDNFASLHASIQPLFCHWMGSNHTCIYCPFDFIIPFLLFFLLLLSCIWSLIWISSELTSPSNTNALRKIRKRISWNNTP